MKTNNRKTNNELSNHELRKVFKDHCSDDDMEKTISDARQAFLFIQSQREFKK